MYSEDSKKKIYYFLSDVFAVIVSYLVLVTCYPYQFFNSKFFAILFWGLVIAVNVLTDEYSYINNRGYLQELRSSIIFGTRVLVLFTFVLILGKVRFIQDISQMSYAFLIQVFVLVTLFVFIGRICVKTLFKTQMSNPKKVLLVTDFDNDKEIEVDLDRFNYHITAYIGKKNNSKLEQPILSTDKDIRDFVANHQVDEIFVVNHNLEQFSGFAQCLRLLGIPTTVAIGNYSNFYVGDSVLKKVGDMTFVTTAYTIVKFRSLVLKRLMDIVIALIGLVLTGIVALIIAPIVKKQSPGPLIFKQKRVGKNGKVFEIYKFRSMYTDAEERKKELLAQNDLDTDLMFKMEDDPRIFPFGHKLRDWSLDELPQFINVLKGRNNIIQTTGRIDDFLLVV